LRDEPEHKGDSDAVGLDARRGRDTEAISLADSLLELAELTERLRRDCPWDREQTAKTIVPHTVEEAYEVADAALADDQAKLLDELGDLLFQTFFLALTLQEKGLGDLESVARSIHAKLVRRHPHIFGEASVPPSARAQHERWEEIKREQEGREGIFHHVPEALPALMHARKVQRRAAAVGFEYPDTAGALADLEDELAELRHELAENRPAEKRRGEELGDVLFACVNVARHLGVDPELELRRATARFVARVEQAERLAAAEGHDWAKLPVADQDRYFDLAKETK
jgi:MazG family protein